MFVGCGWVAWSLDLCRRGRVGFYGSNESDWRNDIIHKRMNNNVSDEIDQRLVKGPIRSGPFGI